MKTAFLSIRRKCAAAMTNAEIKADTSSGPQRGAVVMASDKVSIELLKTIDLHMCTDRDVLDFFRKTGRGYQTRINAVVCSDVEQARRK